MCPRLNPLRIAAPPDRPGEKPSRRRRTNDGARAASQGRRSPSSSCGPVVTPSAGGGLPLATVGAVFLVVSAVAQAAPTPGGLGAMETALIGGLVAAGMGNTVAVPAVFLYRLFTFWVPILPGWLSFQWLERHEYV